MSKLDAPKEVYQFLTEYTAAVTRDVMARGPDFRAPATVMNVAMIAINVAFLTKLDRKLTANYLREHARDLTAGGPRPNTKADKYLQQLIAIEEAAREAEGATTQ